MTTFTHFHFCGGAGGAALGMSRSSAKVGSITAKARCIGGIDSDPAACRDFKSLLGVEQACMDLFDRQTLLLAKLGQTFSLSSTDVWVRPVALAVTIE